MFNINKGKNTNRYLIFTPPHKHLNMDKNNTNFKKVKS